MAIHDPPSSTPTTHGLTRDQILALHTHGSKQTRHALLNTSQPPLTNPLVTCLICIHPYHSANVDGNVEAPVMTACGHVFGDGCLRVWMEDSENGGSGGNNGGTCPMCRFVLRYRECGHLIRAVPAFGRRSSLHPLLSSFLAPS
ncbi:hypothetical protein BGZ57DRAFT_876400 [Hyaloscypha finlandica]|nr:hypothetical protein BGZ57DRAFT_876400 [Hyaloscypha finlandica]